MQNVCVENLSGAALDWAVATSEQRPIRCDPMGFVTGSQSGYWIWDCHTNRNAIYQLIGSDYSPSSNWGQAGPIMERHNIYPSRDHEIADNNINTFQAGSGSGRCYGETPLIAAMRAVVRQQFGDEVVVPERLLNRG